MKKRLLLSAGGTGGHVIPAQALADRIRELTGDVEILFAAHRLSQNPYFAAAREQICDITSSPLLRSNPIQVVSHLVTGIRQSHALLKAWQPDLVVGFGSYYTFPLLVAAAMRGVPIVLHEGNAIPGSVNRLFSRKALFTGVHFPVTARQLKGVCRQVELPLRAGFAEEAVDRIAAMGYFGLHPHLKTILVFGGSQGALFLNNLMMKAATLLKDRAEDWQLLHITGKGHDSALIEEHYRKLKIRACVRGYEPRMELAYKTADLLVARCGAATLAEQIAMAVPAIYVPFPHASGNHQEHNARCMAEEIKGALFWPQSSMTPAILAAQIARLFWQDKMGLEEMRDNLRIYNQQKQGDLAGLLLHYLMG